MTAFSNGKLNGKRVAILVANGFEQVEMTRPRQALAEAGAETHLISPEDTQVQGWNHYDKASLFPVDVVLDDADPNNYDALLLPGGTVNPDQLRVNETAMRFVRSFIEANKPIAAICHGPWSLIEADGVKGRRMTSYPSIKTDLKNAGANWVDEEVVVDGRLVTSRKPDDIDAFNSQVIEIFARS
ncbi:MAG: type 1 glutamine amidotransferase domain-containing protein [Synechococcales bacterium]|nr:type 1 glutamine amidotransferase domain-containing protein [Synechococcales bacterium]